MGSRLSLLLKKVKKYIKSTNFECQQCGECCSIYTICVTHKDVFRIVKTYRLDPYDFLDCMIPDKSVEKSFKDVPRFLGEEGEKWVLCLKNNKKNDGCYFNNSGPCSIYPVRPFICRSFPFLWEHNNLGYKFTLNKEARNFCMGLGVEENKFDFEVVAKDMIKSEREDDEYAKLVEEWNQLVEKKEIKSPSLKKFIDYFMKKMEDGKNDL
ncbi:MAG: YkgJ family cysteine cluster protein [Candidatus Jordarchaeum sp.]|uniref:YkgJ family cysteine cluster protein n=1 Tax=Candidatus Jordarchaeum sp. TaxID=2823881 RepID=UPI00404A4095